MMDDDDLAELRMLRARAYGPSADIHGDVAALQRLSELEAVAHAPASGNEPASAGRPGPASPTAPAGHSDRPAPFEQATGPSHPGPPPPLPPDLRPALLSEPVVTLAGEEAAASFTRPRVAPRRWQLSRGFAVLWLVSLVAVAAVAAGAAFAATWIAPVSRAAGAGAHQIATLDPDPDFAWPAGVTDPGDAAGFVFHGVSILSGGAAFFGIPDGDTCLFAYTTDALGDDGSVRGPTHRGCSAGAFPAAVQFRVDETMPDELRGVVGDGTALQFVFDGGRLGVFADDGATTAGSRSTTG